jgi:hypothetical protein
MMVNPTDKPSAADGGAGEVREIELREVRLGMTLMDDVYTERGTLLVARGFEISASFLERMLNFGPGILAQKVKVTMVAVKHQSA